MPENTRIGTDCAASARPQAGPSAKTESRERRLDLMEIQLPESERRWLHAALVLGTIVLALVLLSQVSIILVFFSDILLTLLLAWLFAFMLSPLVGLLERAFPKLPRAGLVALVYIALFVGLSWILLLVAGSLASS